MTDPWDTTPSETRTPAPEGSLFRYFKSVYESGYAAGYAVGLRHGDRATREDCLDRLLAVALIAARHSGAELTAPQMLECSGYPERAERIRDAVEAGRVAWHDAAARAARLHDVWEARGVTLV